MSLRAAEEKNASLMFMLESHKNELSILVEGRFEIITEKEKTAREASAELHDRLQRDLEAKIKELEGFKEEIINLMRLWDQDMKARSQQSTAKEPQQADVHMGEQSQEPQPVVSGASQEGIQTMIKLFVFNEMNGRIAALHEHIKGSVKSELESDINAKLAEINSKHAQNHLDLITQSKRIDVHDHTLADASSKYRAHTQELQQVRSLIENRPLCVTMEDLNGRLETIHGTIHSNLAQLDSKVKQLEEDLSEQIDLIDTRTDEFIHSGVKTEEGTTVNLKGMERRLMDELNKNMEERFNAMKRGHAMTDAQGDAELQSIAQIVSQNPQFEEKVKTYAGFFFDRNFSDIPKRVGSLERLVSTSSATAPSFQVFQQGATAANAVYSAARP